jgi:DNA-binding transcriptional ArsR family regulator
MGPLRPTIWRTCRVIASEPRLSLLWLLFENQNLGVAELAERVGISNPNASIQLRALAARGLISAVRKKQRVLYMPSANPNVRGAEALLSALHTCHRRGDSFKPLIRQATAFTHPRRIEIFARLCATPCTPVELQEQTGISPPALSHHLSKLTARRFIKKSGDRYRPIAARNTLGSTLQKLVREDSLNERAS